MIFMAVVCDS